MPVDPVSDHSTPSAPRASIDLATIEPATPVEPVVNRSDMIVSPADMTALSRRVEACEVRLAVMSPSPNYWSLKCERLEQELSDSRILISQLREKLHHEVALADHWRRQLKLRHRWMPSLLLGSITTTPWVGFPPVVSIALQVRVLRLRVDWTLGSAQVVRLNPPPVSVLQLPQLVNGPYASLLVLGLDRPNVRRRACRPV